MTEAELAVHNCYFGLSIFSQAPTQEDDGNETEEGKMFGLYNQSYCNFGCKFI